MMYYMNWKLTNAQIELIASDVSVIDYHTGKVDKKSKKITKKDIMKADREWKAKYGDSTDAGKNIDIKDVLNDFNMGKQTGMKIV